MPDLKVLLGGLGIPESPRWHEGRLWFCNWIDRQVVAVDMDGTAEVMLTRDPASHPNLHAGPRCPSRQDGRGK
jgi:hypothetical protein